jgi:rhamnosyl/mannosyltransferase
LVSYKGVEFLIRALENVNARLWIIGTGPLEHSLKNLARAKGLGERVEFLGQLSDQELVRYYHACDVFVLPSVTKAEMFGVVQLEAMACRKPVISTDLPTGVPWVNQHGKTGLVVPPGNTGELANAIQLLLSNAGRREEMGEAGRKRVEQNFTSTRMAAALLQVYQEMLSDPCRADVPSKHPQSEEVVTVPAKWA